MANSTSGESLLERVVRILEAFDHEHPHRTAAEIARSTGLSASTAHRLSMDMLRVGLPARHADGTFLIGRKAWELTARSSPLEELRSRAQPVMEAVLREKVFLTVPDYEKGDVLDLERLDRHDDAEFLARNAGRMEFHDTSPGLVLLKYSPREVRDRILASRSPTGPGGVGADERSVRTTLAEVRSRGTAPC